MERDGKVEADGKHAVFRFKKRNGYSVTTVLAKALRTLSFRRKTLFFTPLLLKGPYEVVMEREEIVSIA